MLSNESVIAAWATLNEVNTYGRVLVLRQQNNEKWEIKFLWTVTSKLISLSIRHMSKHPLHIKRSEERFAVNYTESLYEANSMFSNFHTQYYMFQNFYLPYRTQFPILTILKRKKMHAAPRNFNQGFETIKARNLQQNFPWFMELDITQPCRYSITTFTPPPPWKTPHGHALTQWS